MAHCESNQNPQRKERTIRDERLRCVVKEKEQDILGVCFSSVSSFLGGDGGEIKGRDRDS